MLCVCIAAFYAKKTACNIFSILNRDPNQCPNYREPEGASPFFVTGPLDSENWIEWGLVWAQLFSFLFHRLCNTSVHNQIYWPIAYVTLFYRRSRRNTPNSHLFSYPPSVTQMHQSVPQVLFYNSPTVLNVIQWDSVQSSLWSVCWQLSRCKPQEPVEFHVDDRRHFSVGRLRRYCAKHILW